MNGPSTGYYEFAHFRLEAGRRLLLREGQLVPLTPKAFDTLLALVENRDRVMGKEELIQMLWPESFVEERSLTVNISTLRKALGESATEHRYIVTIPGQGYRFVADLRQAQNGSVETPVDGRDSAIAPSLKRRRWMWPAVVLFAVAGAAVTVWALARNTAGIPETAAGFIRLTSDTGLTMTPALSEDGKLIAYASDRAGEGNLDIWVQQAGVGAALRLTRDATDDYDPSFSPDGRNIAFRSERDGGGIYVIPALGGETRRIAPLGRRPRFSPDGNWIAYSTSNTPGFLPPGSTKLYIVPSGGGTSRELCPEFAAAGFPIWTPDGKHLLFLGNRDPKLLTEPTGNPLPAGTQIDWWVTPIEGGPAVATGANAAFRAAGFSSVSQVPNVWMADRGGVLISAALADTTNLWRVPISTKNWKSSGAPRRLTFGTSIEADPSAGAGAQVAFSSQHENVNIWSLALDANRPIPAGGLQRLTSDAVRQAFPVVSLDGRKLAFSSRRSGYRDIWLKDLATGKETAVTNTQAPDFNPSFSPDGRKLAYRADEKQIRVTYVVDLAEGSPERVCEGCSPGGWSSDGSRLLCRGNSSGQVSILSLTSGRRTELLNHATYSVYNPAFSPDDRWVCFNATTSDRSRIFVVPVRSAGLVSDGEWIPITDGRWDDKARWSPDGNVLYFVSVRDGFRCIWAQRLDPAAKLPAGPAIPVFHAHEARRSLMHLGWGELYMSVARDKIVFNMSERTGNIWMAKLEP